MQSIGYLVNAFKSSRKRVFDHAVAQQYETHAAEQIMRDRFEEVFQNRERAKKAKEQYYPGPKNQFFDNEKKAWKEFVDHAKDKTSLEIGPGPFGQLADWYWMKKVHLIDPLADTYKQFQKKEFGRSFYPAKAKLHSVPAEELVKSLVGKVDGVIITRNALDHTVDPLQIINNISQYAATGCHLFFWTDIWHNFGLDEGHTNISQSHDAIRALLTGFGFKITHEIDHVRTDESTLEYGCRAVKVDHPLKKLKPKKIQTHDPHAG